MENSESKNDMHAYCGLDCQACDAYIATKNDDYELRVKTAVEWTKLNGVEINPSDINCQGCKGDGQKTVFCKSLCEIRKCAVERECDCPECPDFKTCDTVEMIRDHSL